MKFLFFSLLFFCSICHADYFAKVSYVFDGDTVSITKENGTKWRIRLANIDAPEVANKHNNKASQPYAVKSKNYLMSLTLNRTVRVKEKGLDPNGRILGELFIDNTNINKAMVQNGLAWAYKYKIQDYSYLKLEQQAKQKKIGLWTDPNPINPYQWRKR